MNYKLCALALFSLSSLFAVPARAGLFDDDEARRAILDLRQRIEAASATAERRTNEESEKLRAENAQLRRGLLDLQNQIETLNADLARQRGQNEQLARDLSDLQRAQKDVAQTIQGVNERIARVEPVKTTVDGREIMVDPAEKREYESALELFKRGEYPQAVTAFGEFNRRRPQSGYGPAVLFWLGNAQYATRDYKESINSFRAMLTRAPDHPRAPEAVLSIANCQLELKDARAARRTLDDLVKAYPTSEAAIAAKERIAKMR